MRCKNGFTLMEVLVVISIMALMVSLLMPALNQARYQGKNVKDLSNLKQVGISAWMWADDNDDRSLPPEWYENDGLAKITGVKFEDAYNPATVFSSQQTESLYACPLSSPVQFYGSNPPEIISYGINGCLALKETGSTYQHEQFVYLSGRKLTTVKNPATTNHFMCHEKWIVLGDVNFDPQMDPAILPDPTQTRWHKIPSGEFYGTSNIVWLDGHVSGEPEDFEIRWRYYLSIEK
ncbi:MAG: type II secretion system protein [Sedimentisphaerales bacterium]|nr:type II secretion system protein [Sedimentisphaerales bacterium]